MATTKTANATTDEDAASRRLECCNMGRRYCWNHFFATQSIFYIPEAIGAGNGWVIIRLFGSILMGEGVLAPPATFELDVSLIAALRP